MGSFRSYYRIVFGLCAKSICVALLFILTSCGTLKNFAALDDSCASQQDSSNASSLSLFLNINRQGEIPSVTLKISAIEILLDDLWVPFSSASVSVNGADSTYQQKFLGRQWLRGQSCRGIRGKINVDQKPTNISVVPETSFDIEVMLQSPLELQPASSKVLFLECLLPSEFSGLNFSERSFSAYSGGNSRVIANLIYVACPDIDTVYVVRADKFQVVDAFLVKGRPSFLAIDTIDKKIYVLAESLNKIIPFSIPTYYPDGEIIASLASIPKYMFVNNKTAYVLDSQGALTSIDLASGNILNRNRVGKFPNYVCYLSGINKLAVSSTLDQSVYLVDPDSLVPDDVIALGAMPNGLLGWKNYLYVAESSVNSVSIFDMNTRKMLKSIHVGFDPYRFSTSGNSIYITNHADGTLALIQGEQFSVNKEVKIGIKAKEMIMAEKQSLLFVGEGDCSGSLVGIDTTANQVVGRIELGSKPLGIGIFE